MDETLFTTPSSNKIFSDLLNSPKISLELVKNEINQTKRQEHKAKCFTNSILTTCQEELHDLLSKSKHSCNCQIF